MRNTILAAGFLGAGLLITGCDGDETGTGGNGASGGNGGSGGDGGADACADVTCVPPSVCEEKGGLGVCVCPGGYVDQGGECVDIDECKDGSHSCPSAGDCKNLPGSYACTCDPGLFWNGKSCQPAGIRSFDLGPKHGCEIDPEGTLSCWGMIRPGQQAEPAVRAAAPELTSSEKTWASVAAGGFDVYGSTCAIQQDGSLWCWGNVAPGGVIVAEPTQLGTGSPWQNVDVGAYHGCGVRGDGGLWCWGDNIYAQIGDPTVPKTGLPVKIGADDDWVVTTTGDVHSCALKSTGALYCWGLNQVGEVGIGSTASQDTPAKVGGDEWAVVDAGAVNTCAIKLDGSLWCWGANAVGQLGTGELTAQSETPQQVGKDVDWRNVEVGGGYTCATRHDGSLWCWGIIFNTTAVTAAQQETLVFSRTPIRVDQKFDWTEPRIFSSGLAAGGAACARRDDDSIWCWGTNEHGQLARGTFGNKELPENLPGTDWKAVSANAFRSCGVKADGTLWCWGTFFGDISQEPKQVGASSDWATVGVGGNQNCALKSDATLWCWGYGSGTGLGENANALEPTQVGSATDWETIVAGWVSTCGIRTGGDLFCWGENDDGQLGTGANDPVYSPTQIAAGTAWVAVAVGDKESCGVTGAGELFCWGDELGPTPTQVGTETDWTHVAVSNVAASGPRKCGLRAPGTLHCWGEAPIGDGTFQEAPAPVQIGSETTWTSVSVGPFGSCAILKDEGLFCWGQDVGSNAVGTYGSDASPTLVPGTTDMAEVQLANTHVCGRRAGGQAACWGFGVQGQLGAGDAWSDKPAAIQE